MSGHGRLDPFGAAGPMSKDEPYLPSVAGSYWKVQFLAEAITGVS